MNWRIKAAMQFGMALLPGSERLNFIAQKLNGSYRDSAQLRKLLIQAKHVRDMNERAPIQGASVVEIGTGWQGTAALTLYLFGVGTQHTYDTKAHLRWELLKKLAQVALTHSDELSEASGLPKDSITWRLGALLKATSLTEALSVMNVVYHAPADAASTGLPDHSIDIVVSQDVLEHIPPPLLEAITRETVRISNGRICHSIGLHDHLSDNPVNFLKYPEWWWRLICGNSLSYHNRMRAPQFLDLFARHGLKVTWMHKESDLSALKAIRVDKSFSHLPPEDLATSCLDVELAFTN
jgi:hypothetical protein